MVVFQVKLYDGRTFEGYVEDVDVRTDLATIRIPCVSILSFFFCFFFRKGLCFFILILQLFTESQRWEAPLKIDTMTPEAR